MKVTFTKTRNGWKFYSAIQDDNEEYTKAETSFLKSENIPYVIKTVDEFNNNVIEEIEKDLDSKELN